ncbi:MAG: Ppx/GppA family phosphatase [Planctomycetaceae bacterium]|nr:Ppx/GppA family phosphatase [Planctomycetaceae bacterium]
MATREGSTSMQETHSIQGESGSVKTVAAIDIGSNAVRMVVAEVLPDGRISTLERLHRAVRLGQDSFRRGRLGNRSMRAAIAVLRDYRQVLELYHVEQVRAVATSAVREAVNCDTFLDRIFMATKFNVEVIGTSEESRLTVSAVRQAVAGASDLHRDRTLIADVGGGSTLLIVLEEGEIAASYSLRLGSIRLQELFLTGEDLAGRSGDVLGPHITKIVTAAEGSVSLDNIRSFVAVGGDVRFAAQKIGTTTESQDLYNVAASDFNRLVTECEHLSVEQTARKHGLPIADAETLMPALLIYRALLRRTKVDEMIVSRVSMRDGLLLDLARNVSDEEDREIIEGVLHSARTLAEKYRVDPAHARDVAALSIRLFDEFQSDHGLAARERLLLHVAAILHEVGGYVAAGSHHKHSYYLIRYSELFGLTPREVHLVAHIARYHRRSVPKPSHLDYMSLPREQRVVVSKLAAILRACDAVARGQIRNPQSLRFERQDDEFIIFVPGVNNLVLERKAIAAKGDMFEDIYGMRIRLEEA